jgi:thiol-disulfide isomerase/thioredoxin
MVIPLRLICLLPIYIFLVFTMTVLSILSGQAMGQDLKSSVVNEARSEDKPGHLSLLPQAHIMLASARVEGFNLLRDSPPVPDFEMTDETGKPLTFNRFKGKVVLFNLWATWCPPCMREMPDLNALQAEYKDDGFLVVPVASGRQGAEEPAQFLRRLGLDELTTYYDPASRFMRAFDLETLPTSFIIDRDGRLRGGVMGFLDWNSNKARKLIEAFLNERKS